MKKYFYLAIFLFVVYFMFKGIEHSFSINISDFTEGVVTMALAMMFTYTYDLFKEIK